MIVEMPNIVQDLLYGADSNRGAPDNNGKAL